MVSYVLDLNDGVCPFLDERGRCMIHNTCKPYVCRSFPYVAKRIRYLLSREKRIIMPRPEYGVSTACTFISKHRNEIEKEIGKHGIANVFPNEVRVAQEAEEKRRVMLTLLSTLWRMGVVDLEVGSERGIPIPLHKFLRMYYPSLKL